MLELAKRLFIEEEGQGLVEYALIVCLIAIAAIAVMMTMGDRIKAVFTEINGHLST
ncbi:MAG: Flp family type IVb pilin [Eubacteriales bacterium]